jgi:hypothetical protein
MADFLSAAEFIELGEQKEIIEFIDYTVSQINKVIRLRVMSGARRKKWEEYNYDPKSGKPKNVDFRASLIAFSACDEKFKPLFGLEDIPKVSELPMNIIEPLFEAASKINGLGKKEDVEKNLGMRQEDNSTTS